MTFARYQVVPSETLNAMLADIAIALTKATTAEEGVAEIEDLAADAAEAAALAVVAGRGFFWQGPWADATVYFADDTVSYDGSTYVCILGHTSATAVSRPSSGSSWNTYWQIMAARGLAGAGSGDMLGSNNLSEVTNAGTARSNIGAAAASHAHSAADLTSGTVDNARLPTRLQEVALLFTDANSCVTNGWYRNAAAASNLPNASSGYLEVVQYSAVYILQVWWEHSSTASVRQMYSRVMHNSVWSAWERGTWTAAELAASYAGIAYARDLASQAEAQAGTNNTKLLTPLRGKELGDQFYALKARTISPGTGLTGGGDLTANRTLAADIASQVEAEAGASATKLMTPQRVAQAIAALGPQIDYTPVALTDAATIAVDWTSSDENFLVTLAGNRTLGLPTNGVPGTWRSIRFVATGSTRNVTLNTNYRGLNTVLSVATTVTWLIRVYCMSASVFVITEQIDLGAP